MFPRIVINDMKTIANFILSTGWIEPSKLWLCYRGDGQSADTALNFLKPNKNRMDARPAARKKILPIRKLKIIDCSCLSMIGSVL